MSTTTLRVPPDLRDRILRLAEESGTTAHSFMLEAIAERVASEELRRGFLNEGNDRLANMLENGLGIEWADMRDYLGNRTAGRHPSPPTVKKWRA
jgi:predicted transcriptional regulator